MEYRVLGESELAVSAICMGCWALAGDRMWGPQDEEEAIAALRTAVEVGINFFDTAEGYGNGRSESILGRAFRDIRDKVVIATKVSTSHMRPADLRRACENSLRRLQTDYIDIYYLHWPSREVPFSETMGEMARLQSEGKVRWVGCSNFGKQDLKALLQVGRVEVNQLAYSLLFRAIEYEIAPVCMENHVSIAAYSPLLHGILTGKFASLDEIPDARARTRHFSSARRPLTRHGEPGAEAETAEALRRIRDICDQAGLPMAQVALAWVLAQPGVATVVAGARRPEQVRANAEAASLRLSGDVLEALREATDPLKAKLGPNADMWQGGMNSRIR